MASWKENKAVGIAAGVIFVLAVIFVVRGLMARPGEEKLTGIGEKGVPPALEMLEKK